MSAGADVGISEAGDSAGRDLVALLGDGQGHELCGRRRHGLERSGRPRLHGGQRTDHLQRHVLAGLPHGDGEEPVLGLELVLRPMAPDGDSSDQCRLAPPQQLVGIDGEVRPGERAETDVRDARRRGAVVLRSDASAGAWPACSRSTAPS